MAANTHVASEAIAQMIYAEKEQRRLKARFRDDDQQLERVRLDARMALAMASKSTEAATSNARGYLASTDSAYRRMERSKPWGDRPRVLLDTRVLPQLVEFLCGTSVQHDEVVRLLFNPLVGAAAAGLAGQIETLTGVGIDLQSARLERLEWDLQRELGSLLHDFELRDDVEPSADAVEGDDGVKAALTLVDGARRAGYDVDARVEKVLENYAELEERLAQLSTEHEALASEAINARRELSRVAKAAAGTTKRGRRQVRRALHAIGLDLDEVVGSIE